MNKYCLYREEMLLNTSRYKPDRAQFPERVGRMGGVVEVLDLPYAQGHNFSDRSPSRNSVVELNKSNGSSFQSSYSNNGTSKDNAGMNNNIVYENCIDPRFTKSNVSAQNTLMSQETNSTIATTLSELEGYHPIEKVEELEANLIDYMHNPRRNSITSSIKVGKHFDNINASRYSIHSCKKTSVTNVSKNNIVLINNMPYPVQLHFPAKISNRKTKEAARRPELRSIENKENMLDNYAKIHRNSNVNTPSLINDYNKTTFIDSAYYDQGAGNKSLESINGNPSDLVDPRPIDSYDLLLQLIQSYLD